MLQNRLRLGVISAWLGVIALGCNALLPIRFTFALSLDLAHARQCGHYEGGPVSHDASWWLLGLLAGQDQTADPSRSHKGFHPVLNAPCGAIGAVTAFAPPAPALLTAPNSRSALSPPQIDIGTPPTASFAPYHSRAPPSA